VLCLNCPCNSSSPSPPSPCCYPNAIFNFRDSQMQDKLESMLPLSSLIRGCHAEECAPANWLISMEKKQWWGECWGINYRPCFASPGFRCPWFAKQQGWASHPSLDTTSFPSGILRWGCRPHTQHTQRSRERKMGAVSPHQAEDHSVGLEGVGPRRLGWECRGHLLMREACLFLWYEETGS
jgi:hypothetical protein